MTNSGITTIGSTSANPNCNIRLPLYYKGNLEIGAISLEIDYDGRVLQFINDKGKGITKVDSGLSAYGKIVAAETDLAKKPNMKKLRIMWYATDGIGHKIEDPSGLICNFSFKYFGGVTNVMFNNTDGGGSYCEFASGEGIAYNDYPGEIFYINGVVKQNE